MVLIILFRFLYFQCENLIDLFSNNFSVDKFLKHLNKLFDKSNSNTDNTLGNIFIKVIEKILLKISDFISSNLSLPNPTKRPADNKIKKEPIIVFNT